MYITKVELTDVRCFEKATIDLTDAPVGTSVLIAGNNGIGKSSILRAIAMGLCDRDSAASLLRELEGSYIRKEAVKSGDNEKKVAKIRIELKDCNGNEWTITTTVNEWKQLIIERVDQTYESMTTAHKDDFEGFYDFWHILFVSGYGAGLRTSSTAKFSDYFAPDSLYSLFKYDAPLQDPEMAWRRLRAAAKRSKFSEEKRKNIDNLIQSLLGYILDIPAKNINLHPNGIFVSHGKDDIPLDSIGDGHQSLVKIVLDVLLWYLLKINYDEHEQGEDRDWTIIEFDKDSRPMITGIVIIDEIEQHLHPKLQRQVIKRLSDKFPYIQFVMTTHSPLCVSGTADVLRGQEEVYKVFSLCQSHDEVILEKKNIPYGLRADEILVDYFELPTTINIDSEVKLNRLTELFKKNRLSTKEKLEFDNLEAELKARSSILSERTEDRKKEIEQHRITKEFRELLVQKGLIKDDPTQKN